MNKKNRKLALAIIEKKSFKDTSAPPGGLDNILNDPSLNTITDPKEFAHQLFIKMLEQINLQMKMIGDKIISEEDNKSK